MREGERAGRLWLVELALGHLGLNRGQRRLRVGESGFGNVLPGLGVALERLRALSRLLLPVQLCLLSLSRKGSLPGLLALREHLRDGLALLLALLEKGDQVGRAIAASTDQDRGEHQCPTDADRGNDQRRPPESPPPVLFAPLAAIVAIVVGLLATRGRGEVVRPGDDIVAGPGLFHSPVVRGRRLPFGVIHDVIISRQGFASLSQSRRAHLDRSALHWRRRAPRVALEPAGVAVGQGSGGEAVGEDR